MLPAIRGIFRWCFPLEMAGINATLVTFAAVVGGLVLWRWRLAMDEDTHESVRPVVLSISTQHSTAMEPEHLY